MTNYSEALLDVRAPLALRSDWWWLLAFLILMLVAGAVWGVIVVFSRMRKPRVVAPEPDPWDVALKALDQLAQGSLLAQGHFKEYSSVLSGIVRSYIEARFRIRAPEMTTEEFLEASKASPHLTNGHKQLLQEVLDVSDRIKFAKFIPLQEDMQESWRVSRRFVEDTRLFPEKEMP